MPLKAYRNKFEHTHENEFFRFLSTELEKKWGDKRDTAYLIGNPRIIGDDGNPFSPDILFISKNIFVIMELKDYGGEISFFPGFDFSNALWKTGNTIIKGGSYINPFAQVKSYRNKIRDYLIYYINELSEESRFNADRIKSVVCFQKDIVLSRDIPGKFSRWFYIKDRRDIINWFDDVVSPEIDLIDKDLDKVVSLFYQPEFQDILEKDKPIEISDDIGVEEEKPPEVDYDLLNDAQKNALSYIEEFVKNDDQILILSGITNSGKTYLINFIRSHLINKTSIKQIVSLAPSNRIVGHLNNSVPGIRSVYGSIYTRNMFETSDSDSGDSEEEEENEGNKEEDKDKYKIIFDLRENTDDSDCVYIVDESHLITDSHFETPLLKFGTGKLLNDLLTYVNPKNTKRKIIFIGDKYLTGYGGRDISALSEYYLSDINDYKVSVYDLRFEDDISGNIITREFVSPIIKSIDNKQFNTLTFTNSERIQILETEALRQKCGENIKDGEDRFKILTYSNEQAKTLNSWVKKEIFGKYDYLEKGDLVVFFNTVILPSDDPFTMPQKIFNGEYAEIIDIADSVEIKQQKLRGRDKPVELRYRRVVLKIIDRDITVKGYYLENFWESEQNQISNDEYIAIQAYYNTLVSRKVKETITDTREWKELINSPEYKQLKNELERLEKSDNVSKKKISEVKRKIKELERTVRRNYINKVRNEIIKNDPFVNPIFLRLGYAITVHKAIGSKWNNVLLNMYHGEGKGVTNEEYFRWVYTGISRAKDMLYLSNPPKISPYMKISWKHVNLNYEQVSDSRKNNTLPVYDIGDPGERERNDYESEFG